MIPDLGSAIQPWRLAAFWMLGSDTCAWWRMALHLRRLPGSLAALSSAGETSLRREAAPRSCATVPACSPR